MTSIREHSSDDQARPGVATVPNAEGGASVFGIGPGADGTQGGVGLPRPVNPSTPHSDLEKHVGVCDMWVYARVWAEGA